MARTLSLIVTPFLLVLAAACSSTPAASATGVQHSCSGVAGKHHVYVVVVHGSGSHVTACVGFDGAKVSGSALMSQSRLKVATQSTQYGPAVCAVDNEPAHYSSCFSATAPYWAFWIWDGSSWTMGQTGYAAASFTDHQAIGWVYTPATGSPAPPPPPPSA